MLRRSVLVLVARRPAEPGQGDEQPRCGFALPGPVQGYDVGSGVPQEAAHAWSLGTS
jgi:hypothetical protein